MWTLLTRIHLVRRLWRDGLLAWRLFRDPRTPLLSKLILAGTGVWIVLPFSLIPIVGQLEALAVLSLGIELFLRSVPGWLKSEHAARATQSRKAW
jgi:uncharacterized membrane protein YkvA (DUF1232 family)